MVYIDPDDLGWLPYVKSWVGRSKAIIDDMKDYVLSLFKVCIDKVFTYIRKNCDEGIRQVNIFKL